jgi:hypothetical protein
MWSRHQYQVLVSFVHHLAYYRVLLEIYSNSDKKSEFWTRTIDAHILRAIIDWCMVFGADSNATHWKKVARCRASQSAFRKHLKAATGITGPSWKKFWRSMTEFRNKYAAHRTVEGTYPPVPMVDTALLVAIAYDDWLRSRIQASFSEPSLQKRYQRLTRTSPHALREAMSHGPWVLEEYEGRLSRATE